MEYFVHASQLAQPMHALGRDCDLAGGLATESTGRTRSLHDAGATVAQGLPRVLSLRIRFNCSQDGQPSGALAQQWRGAIKRALQQVLPGALDHLIAPERAAENSRPPIGRKYSNFSTPGFALFVEPDAFAHGGYALHLTFFEHAAIYVPAILQAVMMQQTIGLGARRQAFEVSAVDAFLPDAGWVQQPALVRAIDTNAYLYQVALAPQESVVPRRDALRYVSVCFTTRLVLLQGGHALTDLRSWGDFGGALIRRASQLRRAWSPAIGEAAESEWLAACQVVNDTTRQFQLIDSSLRTDHGTLSSGRQQTRYVSAGLVGTTVWAAPAAVLAAWVPLLRFAEVALVGQQTTAGMGRVLVLAP